MAKKQIKTKRPYKKYVLVAIAVSVSVLILFNGLFLYYLHRASIAQNNFGLMYKVTSAIDNLQIGVDKDPQSGKLYLTDARLVLPAQSDTPKTPVTYWGALTKEEGGVHISNNADYRSAKAHVLYEADNPFISVEDLFKQVPKLQACSRGVFIATEDIEGSGDQFGSKVLSNGQTVRFYMEKDCFNQEFIDYVKQVDSY